MQSQRTSYLHSSLCGCRRIVALQPKICGRLRPYLAILRMGKPNPLRLHPLVNHGLYCQREKSLLLPYDHAACTLYDLGLCILYMRCTRRLWHEPCLGIHSRLVGSGSFSCLLCVLVQQNQETNSCIKARQRKLLQVLKQKTAFQYIETPSSV